MAQLGFWWDFDVGPLGKQISFALSGWKKYTPNKLLWYNAYYFSFNIVNSGRKNRVPINLLCCRHHQWFGQKNNERTSNRNLIAKETAQTSSRRSVWWRQLPCWLGQKTDQTHSNWVKIATKKRVCPSVERSVDRSNGPSDGNHLFSPKAKDFVI